MGAGELKHRLRFEARESFDDGYGNTQSDFASRFTRWAAIKPLKGGETVMASRLQGTQPVLIVVRLDPNTKSIAPDWRAVDVKTGAVYALHSVADMEQKRLYLTLTATAGVAA